MPLEIWIAYVIAAEIILLIPGPTILTVVSYSITHGRSAQIPLVAAVALGDSTALAFSLLGLGALLSVSALWFSVIKWIGGAYLIYLGVKLLRSDSNPLLISDSIKPETHWRLFGSTWLVTALNPKGIVFFVAFLPQFINPNAAISPQLWILSATFVIMATLNAALYGIFATSARKLLTSPTGKKRFNLAGGSLLTAAGVWALSARQPG